MSKLEIVGTCRWCGDEDAVFENQLCEECDSRIYVCSVCNEDQTDSDHCRHIFQGEDLEWRGSGAWMDPDLKQPLFRIFDLMPSGFSEDLKRAIESKKFYTWLIAPMIGAGGLLELHGMPKRKGIRYLFGWGEKLIEIGQGDHAEETSDAYHWLVGLYEDKTPDANNLTLKWINEYSTLGRS